MNFRKALITTILLSLSANLSAEQIFKETIYERYNAKDDATITIRTEKGSETVGINGFALFNNTDDGPRVATVDVKAKLVNGLAQYSDGQCGFTLKVDKKELEITSDTGKCGETGTNFNGKYHKRTFFKNFYKKIIVSKENFLKLI